MESHFSSQFFITNRQKLKQLFPGQAPIVVTANGVLQRGGDYTYPFYQDASFWYLTGISEPNIILVIDNNGEYLIIPDRSSVMEFFEGVIDPVVLSSILGIKDIYGEKEGYRKLKAKTKKVKHVATLAAPGSYIENFGFYTNPARAKLAEILKSYKNFFYFHRDLIH